MKSPPFPVYIHSKFTPLIDPSFCFLPLLLLLIFCVIFAALSTLFFINYFLFLFLGSYKPPVLVSLWDVLWSFLKKKLFFKMSKLVLLCLEIHQTKTQKVCPNKKQILIIKLSYLNCYSWRASFIFPEKKSAFADAILFVHTLRYFLSDIYCGWYNAIILSLLCCWGSVSWGYRKYSHCNNCSSKTYNGA